MRAPQTNRFAAFIISTLACCALHVSAAQSEGMKSRVSKLIQGGTNWLESSQNEAGWWSTADHPAVTGLALVAMKGDPSGKFKSNENKTIQDALKYIDSCYHEDGGIYRINLTTYNTAICLMSMVAVGDPSLNDRILKSREYLIGMQSDFGDKGVLDHPMDGGIGYGSKYDHSDMGNTLQALEALHYSQHLAQDQPASSNQKLDFAAAIQFLQNCQNLTSVNKQDWASDDEANKGGFIYYPGLSKAGEYKDPVTGRVALRSYGSISYGGMLGYAYAKLGKESPQVQAVLEWLQANYTLEENPAMGMQGLFYYYHTMAKALTAYGVETLELKSGEKVNWREKLVNKLASLQNDNGSWINENGRWWERDPALVTSYAVLALEKIYYSLD
jgi:squalene-hopene/tetraprenyl-beta-curcumene cyclase